MRRSIHPTLIYLFFSLFFLSLLLVKWQSSAPDEKPQNQVETVQQTPSKIDLILSGMTLDEKVGQLFFSRVPAVNQVQDIETYHLGGYLLFGQDMEWQTLDSLRETIASYQSVSKIPLLIGSDEEGGTVTRLSQLLDNPFASPAQLYAAGGLDAIVEDTRQKADILRSVGIHTGLFPLADMAWDPNSFIYDRTVGSDLSTTEAYVSEVVKTLSEKQIGSTLKHFPGYGDNGDSHTDIIYDNRPLKSFQATDFKPFEAGIKAGADSILVSHNIVSAIDTVPSSISPAINRILRQDLNFDGVIMTDDMDMAGLADFVDQDDAAFRVLQAGNDMIMSSRYQTQIPYLLAKLETGDLTEERLDQSVRRILQWKEKLGLLE